MSFNSYQFLIFFPITVILYFVIPKKAKNLWLLICSYYFYMSWNPVFILLLIFSTLVTYTTGILLDKSNKDERLRAWKKTILSAGIIINIGLLLYFKYTGFLADLIDRFTADVLHTGPVIGGLLPEIVLPVGISFFTFQALGYVIDVYRGDI